MKTITFITTLVLRLCLVSTHSLPGEVADDCRNRTLEKYGGDIHVMSWHIHYTTNTSDMPRFERQFTEHFYSFFAPAVQASWQKSRFNCPFGANFGSNLFNHICGPETFHTYYDPDNATAITGRLLQSAPVEASHGNNPFSVPTLSFFIPLEHIEETWAWALEHQGHVDLFKHPNTGCMHDDHGPVRGEWVRSRSSTEVPVVDPKKFPCNKPGSGCNDWYFTGAMACGCDAILPLKSDAPKDACYFCSTEPYPELGFLV